MTWSSRIQHYIGELGFKAMRTISSFQPQTTKPVAVSVASMQLLQGRYSNLTDVRGPVQSPVFHQELD
jgi:hypothetical protein